jgi:hypothetical protein
LRIEARKNIGEIWDRHESNLPKKR